VLREISAGARRTLSELAAGKDQAGEAQEIAMLRDAIRRAEAVFAVCDSPM